jgi:C-terminal processing protease CtpA/Prc
VALLTSGATFSAAETFALAMRVRDHVSIIGEPSSGHFSDMMDHELPNGWELTLSGERYSAADGVIYETRGVPVDVAVTMDAAALPEGTDNMLEAALRELGATR